MTSNNSKLELENVKSVQDTLRQGSLSSLSANIKRLKLKLDQFSSILSSKEAEALEIINAKKAAELAKEKSVEKAKQPVTTQNKPTEQKREPSSTKVRTFNNDGNSGYGARNNVGGQRPYNNNANGEYKRPSTGYNTDRPAGQGRPGFTPRTDGKPAYSPRPGFAPKPGFASKAPVKEEKIDASTLTKNTQHVKKKTFDKPVDDKKAMNKRALLMRGYVADSSLSTDSGDVRVSGKKRKNKQSREEVVIAPITHAVITTENLTVKLLAEKIGKPVAQLISKFLLLGIMVNINSNIDYESAELIATEFGITLEKKVEKTYEEKIAELLKVEDKEEDLQVRPPVVTIMGHVDHGKTSLLDRIRQTNIATAEAGGITQAIGAYTIKVNDKSVTFIDTPGHEAFTAMRQRGAKLTDIAILVVAADDGVMPQTKESIKHIKQANIPMIVAINKIDKENANIDKIKQQLAENDVIPEEWGGDAILVPVSARTGDNIDKLLEMILFVAEYQNIKANPNAKATGCIIEARLDKGFGAVATVLVQNGTLKTGDHVVIGLVTGKIRVMTNDKGERVKCAGPSTPVQIIGLSGVPNAGDMLYSVDEKMSKNLAIERQELARSNMIKGADLSLDSMLNKLADSNFKDYNVIVKGDVSGSVEALKQSLSAISNEEVKVRCIHGGVGNITENDVSLAIAAKAVIIAFNVKAEFTAKVIAEKEHIEIHQSKIIYEVLDFVKQRIDKMLTPKYKEVVIGHAEIRVIFKASKFGSIAGSYITDGKVTKDSKVRITRGKNLVFEGAINSLQREKDQASEVKAGFECGITFAGFTEMQEGDIIEAYIMQRIN